MGVAPGHPETRAESRRAVADAVVIVGCGRVHRRDDEFGLRVAAELSNDPPPAARVVSTQSPGADILAQLDESVRLLVIIDAARNGPAGEWRRIVYGAQDNEQPRVRSALEALQSSHSISIASALRLGAEMGMLPPTVWIYAAFGADFGYGEGLSAPLASVATDVLNRIRADLKAGTPSSA